MEQPSFAEQLAQQEATAKQLAAIGLIEPLKPRVYSGSVSVSGLDPGPWGRSLLDLVHDDMRRFAEAQTEYFERSMRGDPLPPAPPKSLRRKLRERVALWLRNLAFRLDPELDF